MKRKLKKLLKKHPKKRSPQKLIKSVFGILNTKYNILNTKHNIQKHKASLHNHTSSEKRDPVKYSDKDLIDHAAKKGFKILAITLHNKWSGSQELIDYAKSKGILLIPGTEQSIWTRHILILNAKPEAEKVRSFKSLKKYKKEHPESFIIANHPYFPGLNIFRDTIKKNIDCFDAIEFSWWYSKLIDFNKRGKKLAKKHKLPFIGTSDTHFLKWFETTYCEIKVRELSTEDVIKALRKGHFRNVSRPIPTWEILILMPFIVLRDKLWLLKENIKKIKLSSKNKNYNSPRSGSNTTP